MARIFNVTVLHNVPGAVMCTKRQPDELSIEIIDSEAVDWRVNRPIK